MGAGMLDIYLWHFFLRIFHLPTLSLLLLYEKVLFFLSFFTKATRALCVCFFLKNFLIYLNTKSKIMGITGR